MKFASLFLATLFVVLTARVLAGASDFFDLPDKIVVPKSLAVSPPSVATPLQAVPVLAEDVRATPPATPTPISESDFSKTAKSSPDATDRGATPPATPAPKLNSDFFKTTKSSLDATDRRTTPSATSNKNSESDFYKAAKSYLESPEKERDEDRLSKAWREWERGEKGRDRKRWKK